MGTAHGFSYSVTETKRYGLHIFVGRIFLSKELVGTTEAWSSEGCRAQVFAAIYKLKGAIK